MRIPNIIFMIHQNVFFLSDANLAHVAHRGGLPSCSRVSEGLETSTDLPIWQSWLIQPKALPEVSDRELKITMFSLFYFFYFLYPLERKRGQRAFLKQVCECLACEALGA